MSKWDGVVEVVGQHFVHLIRLSSKLIQGALEQVIKAQTKTILDIAIASLEAPITLEELQVVASKLSRNKVPGWDGIPAEFYVTQWDQIGPVLLEVLREGLDAGIFHPNIVRGIIVLLAKKGDQLLIENKRGLTLLN